MLQKGQRYSRAFERRVQSGRHEHSRWRATLAKRRFKNMGTGSFLGQFVYERAVPRNHPLVSLNQLIDWDAFVDLLLPAAAAQAWMRAASAGHGEGADGPLHRHCTVNHVAVQAGPCTTGHLPPSATGGWEHVLSGSGRAYRRAAPASCLVGLPPPLQSRHLAGGSGSTGCPQHLTPYPTRHPDRVCYCRGSTRTLRHCLRIMSCNPA